MKIVFMGTPDFAVPSLHALTEAGYAVAAVVTQPDKPKGRGKTLLPTPVKEEAVMHDIPVYQPEKVRNNPEFLEILKEINPEIIVVAAYGQIIPKEILELPKFGCINIHASLLPKYRGAAPIQQAVIDGEKVSGVTIQQMGEGLDTGDMISKIVIPISPTETGGSLFGKLAQAGADLLIKTLPSIEQGTAEFEKQPEELASFLQGDSWAGLNVTIPYKEAVIPYCDVLSDEASEIGAVNTIVRDGERLIGHNTDYAGFRALLRENGVFLPV